MTSQPDEVEVTIRIPAHWMPLLEALTSDGARYISLPDVQSVIVEILDHVQQGVYRPGAWERGWLEQALGGYWLENLEPDDDPQQMSADGRIIFDRPRAITQEEE